MGKQMPYIYNVGQYVNVTLKIVKQTRVKCGKYTRKGYVVQSVVYPNAPTYEISETNLKNGQGCAYKAGKRVCEENNLYSIVYIRPYLVNVEESKNITFKSNKPVLFKCSTVNCDNTKKMAPNTLVRQGYSCPNCSTGISYPERFMMAVNQYFNLSYDYQVTYEHGRFDFINHETKVVIEMNGIAHYEERDGYMSHETTKLSDNKKRKWCKENGYTLIFIDARKSDFNFIKDNINACEYLPNILLKDEKAIMELIEISSKYDIQEIIRLYEVEKLSTVKIAQKYEVSFGTICGILNRNNIKLRGNIRPVKCVETGIVYESVTEAQRQTGIAKNGISACCRGKRKTSGGFHWEFVD